MILAFHVNIKKGRDAYDKGAAKTTATHTRKKQASWSAASPLKNNERYRNVILFHNKSFFVKQQILYKLWVKFFHETSDCSIKRHDIRRYALKILLFSYNFAVECSRKGDKSI